MPTIPGDPVGRARSIKEEFLELVCADKDLLRAEFDAIIAQGWPTSRPPASPEAKSGAAGPHRPRQPERRGVRALRDESRHPHGRLQGRQRSPPQAA
jgi:hypothetical protein